MNDFSLLIPEFLVAGLAFFILALDLFIKENWKRYLVWLAFFGLAVIIHWFLNIWMENKNGGSPLWLIDRQLELLM